MDGTSMNDVESVEFNNDVRQVWVQVFAQTMKIRY